MGIDTVKLSYPVGSGLLWPDSRICEFDANGRAIVRFGEFVSRIHDHGSRGPVSYRTYHHPDLRNAVTVKGVRGSSVSVMYEGSVPRELGLYGPAEADCIAILDAHLRSIFRDSGLRYLPRGSVRRCDFTHDESDPDGSLRSAAIGYQPHARSRYVQARYQEDETVFLYNKSRGLRVYDKHAEELTHHRDPDRAEWARDLTRIEYQLHSAWCEKLGLSVDCDWADKERQALDPVVNGLLERVGIHEDLRG